MARGKGLTVRSILRGTLRFVAAHPRQIAVWAAVYFVASLLARTLAAPFYAARAAALAQGVPPDGAFLGRMLIAAALLAVTVLVLNAAVFRAVLFPEQRRACYMRLGGDEARLIGLAIVLWIGFVLIALVTVVALFVLGVLGGVALRPSQPAAALVGGVVVLGLWLGVIHALVRLSLAGPLTLARGEIAIGEAWRMGGGRVWRLFGAYLVLWIGIAIVAILLSLPQTIAMLHAAAQPGGAALASQLAAYQAQQSAPGFTLAAILGTLAGLVIGTLGYVLFAAAPAVAVAQLIDEQAGIA